MRFTFMQEIRKLIDSLEEKSSPSIEKAITICTASIAKGRVVNLFGAGHSALPCMEAFPRIGSFVGFHQITEPGLGFNGFVTGKGGQRQMSFMENTPGLAKIIFENYNFTPDDSLIIFSHSGINAVPVELAEEANKVGMQSIAVMSLAHSATQRAKAPSGKKLNEVASVVIDTTVPPHDAVVEVGNSQKSGGASTVIAMIIIDTIVSECAKRLYIQDFPLKIYPSHNVSEDLESVLDRERALFDAYKQLIAKL